MIRELRARHRAVFAVLAVGLPIGLGFALASRGSVPPISPGSPGPIEAAAGVPSGTPEVDTRARAGDVELRVRMWRPEADGAVALELRAARDLELPDVLVYWADSDQARELPPNAVLLGPLAGTRARCWRLPRRAPGVAGRLYLYSLGHQELAASLELPR